MFKINLDSTIQMLVDHELDRKTPIIFTKNNTYIKPGVYVKIHLKAEDYDTGKQDLKSIYMLFTGNTSVFYAISNSPFIFEIPVNRWINTSNHDSCWRSDGFNILHTLYFNMCKNVNKNIAPKDVETRASLSLGLSYPIYKCKVEFASDEKIDNHYKIIKIKEEK